MRAMARLAAPRIRCRSGSHAACRSSRRASASPNGCQENEHGKTDYRGGPHAASACGWQYHGAPPKVDQTKVEAACAECRTDRKSTRLNSSHVAISYAVCCLKKKNRG